MHPSTWNDTNQHWTPQFLLKGFGIKGHASKVYALETHTSKITIRKVGDMASKLGLLTERDDHLMKRIEARSARVVNRIRKGDLGMRPREREVLDSLVFALMRNDPYSGSDDERTRREVVHNFSLELTEAIQQQRGLVSLRDVKEFADRYLSHDFLSIAMDPNDSLVLRVLRLMGLSVHVPEDGEHLVIGDSPVLVVRGEVAGVTNLLNPGSQIILPIHSRCLLVYSWDTPFNLIQSSTHLDSNQVRSLNSDYLHGTNSQFIFGRTRESLLCTQIPQVQPEGTARSSAVNIGWLMLQSELAKISRTRTKRDAEEKGELDLVARELVRRNSAEAEKA